MIAAAERLSRAAIFPLTLFCLAQFAPGSAYAENIFVSDFNAHVVREYTDSGAFVRNLTTGGNWDPYDLTFGPNGMLYAVNFSANHLEEFDPKTGAYLGAVGNISAVVASPGSTSSLGVTVGPDGNFYVVTNGDGVFKIDPTQGTNPAGTTQVTPAINGTFDLAFMPTSPTTLLAMYNSGNKVIYDATGDTFATGVVNARGITFGPDGRLYIADRSDFATGRGHILVAPATGGAAVNFATSPTPPSGEETDFNYIDFDSAGNLWASTSEGLIMEFNGTTGAYMESIGQTAIANDNLIAGLGIAVEDSDVVSVPESGSVALLLLCGLGLVGAMIRRAG